MSLRRWKLCHRLLENSWGGRLSLAAYVTVTGPRGLCLGSWGGRRPSMVGYVTVTGAKDGATAAGCRSCCLSSLAVELQQLERQVDSARLKVSQRKNEQQASGTRLTLDQLQSERREGQASIDKLRHESAARRRGFVELERSLREDTQKTTIRTGALRAELHPSRGNELLVSGPCAGTVLWLWVQRPGAIVKEGEPLGDIAWGRGPLQAELTVPSAGVGQIKPGHPVKLLYDSLPYQRHGVRRATVRWVSPASVGAHFRVFADIEDGAITVKGEPRALTAGMGGRADVVVGRRSLITYAFEPLRQLKESLADAPPAAGGRGSRP